MTKEDCRDCCCLVCGKKGEWICDECEKEITLIEKCPEESEKKEYTILIREVLETSVTVRAKSLEDAKDKVEEDYFNEEVILTADDFAYREMREENEEEWRDF